MISLPTLFCLSDNDSVRELYTHQRMDDCYLHVYSLCQEGVELIQTISVQASDGVLPWWQGCCSYALQSFPLPHTYRSYVLPPSKRIIHTGAGAYGPKSKNWKQTCVGLNTDVIQHTPTLPVADTHEGMYLWADGCDHVC